MPTIVISIGRNIGDEPMPLDRWLSFTLDVLQAVEGEQLFVGYGVGQYEGGAEESFTIIASGSVSRDTLAHLSEKYEQQSIAYSVINQTEFV